MLQVIGDPIFHSKSPVIQTTMLDYLGLDIPYTPHLVKKGEVAQYLAQAEVQGITGFNATMPHKEDLVQGITGFNATMPHKEDLVPLMDQLGEEVELYGAVNTVCRRDGQWIGHNTDGDGCLESLVHMGMWPARQVVLLGAGGAARAVALRLAQTEAERIWVCNRTLPKAHQLCQLDASGTLIPVGFDPSTLSQVCSQSQLVINCTNLGMDDCPHQFEDFSFLDAPGSQDLQRAAHAHLSGHFRPGILLRPASAPV